MTADLLEKIRVLEEANDRLRAILAASRSQIQGLTPGYWLLTDDGSFECPADSEYGLEKHIQSYLDFGEEVTVVQVIGRKRARVEDDDGWVEFAGEFHRKRQAA